MRWTGWGRNAVVLVGVGLAGVGVTVAQTTAEAAKDKPAAPMTQAQAKELFRSVDEILGFVSQDTKLPIKHSVKRKLVSRDQIEKYLTKKFNEDESAKRMQRSELVLKKFGLLDRDFHLRPFMLSLLTEQIAGFYDNKSKTVNLLDWIAPDEQKPVLAHELTHALQDQKVNLTKWSDVSLDDTSKNVKDDNKHLLVDEAETAREAVAEGQAMAVFVDYSLKPAGRSIADAPPELMAKLKDTTADSSDSPVMARAPLLLQESLLFPYSDGLSFEHAILIKGGKDAAFAQVLANPPSSSFEILHPDAYMAHAPVPVLRLPDIHPLLDAQYDPYDVGVMGELDVRILAELFGGREMAQGLAPDWDGGIYYAAQKKNATPQEKESTASIGLLYYSRWKNADSAKTFLRIYGTQMGRKYSMVKLRKDDAANDGEQVFTTNEGDVLLSLTGSTVFISEGFDVALARKLRDSIASVQSEGPTRLAVVGNEPSLSLARYMGSFGAMKASLAERYTSEGQSTGAGDPRAGAGSAR
ncbi:MAG: hypothetical protein PW789_14685 [Edaphobacter sp.]|uniref:hypothetical protein n=1 Tax=Edaphobacter sp. TaxID=1934404 RepID=UPI00239532B4|nr:hypothetical protein [Edaphobacter sp.]MDE1177826.1 hypothetical protein [Edaphobacter sp.]